jgi:two-component system OmpR family response regulator
MKILLAEDDQNISIIAHMTLEELGGHDVTVVNDGEAALEAALENKYDLILLDEMMPKINGLRVSEMYRQQREGKQAPIIFLSAKSQESDIEKFLSNGKGHILKPFDPATLCQTIVKIMEDAS